MTYGADMRLLVNDGGFPTVLFGAGQRPTARIGPTNPCRSTI